MPISTFVEYARPVGKGFEYATLRTAPGASAPGQIEVPGNSSSSPAPAAKPTIAPPKSLWDIERFATSLQNQLERRPSLTTLTAHKASFDKIDEILGKEVRQTEARLADWEDYEHLSPRDRPSDVEDPGPLSSLYEGVDMARGAVNQLRTLADVATVAGQRSAVALSPALVDKAKDGVNVLTDLRLIGL